MAKTVRRRQLTAFLPRPWGYEIDRVRRHWDPAMAAQIDSHFTICHDLTDVQVTALQVLRQWSPLRVGIGRVRCWGEPSRGIYLDVRDTHGTVPALRRALAIDDPSHIQFTPHVTLTHPRTTPHDVADAAWAALSAWELNVDVAVDVIDIIDHDGAR